MARYRIAYWLKGKPYQEHLTEPVSRPEAAQLPPGVSLDRCKVVTLLRDSEGEDHPANAGKFFLDRIIK